MRKILLLLALTTTAQAAKVDCKTVNVQSFFLNYSDVAEFPNPVQETTVYFYKKTSPVTFKDCGLSITGDRNKMTVQADTLDQLFRVFGSTSLSMDITLYTVKGSGATTGYLRSADINIERPLPPLQTEVRVTGSPSTVPLPADAVMAVRADNGKLLPFLYRMDYQRLKLPRTLQVLNLYVRSSVPTLFSRMELNVARKSVTFYRTFPFPAK